MQQLDIFSNQESGQDVRHIRLQDGELIYYPSFYSREVADRFFAVFKKDINWKQESMMMYGKTVLYPRLTAWYGDNGKSYAYSGSKFDPFPWTEELLTIKNDLQKTEETPFNSVLLNYYRDGNDSVSWHTDAEPELGINPVIASVNFGATRRFMLRRIDDHSQKTEIALQHGSLLLMKGALQHNWQHQIPKTAQKTMERINLTYRVIY